MGRTGIDATTIAGLAESLESREVKLLTPPQLRVAYLTAWPVGGSVAFRPDIYKLDGSGFTVGQPLPTGELSAEGQPFVLKPVPRLVADIEGAGSESDGLYGGYYFAKKAAVQQPVVARPAPAVTGAKISCFKAC